MRVRGKIVSTIFVAIAGSLVGAGIVVARQESANPITASNYLYIEEFEFAAGVVPNAAIAEASQWVKDMRKTGEFKSVRLFIHNTGPRFALYVLTEPKSWQAIETGFGKFLAARADVMTKPQTWAGHSDNLLSEIPVQ
jgi:hypothetical protein